MSSRRLVHLNVLTNRRAEPDERFRSERHRLINLTLLVTEECNLRCDYCYIRKIPRHMSQQTADRAIEFLFENGREAPEKLSICFFGGEPMLVPELIEHVCSSASSKARALRRQIVFSMTSNATLIDERRAALIHRHNISTMLSLDGIGEAHDRYRKTVAGKGSFRLIERNLERLLGLPGVKIRLTVGPETAAQLPESIRWLFERGFRQVAFTPVVEANWDLDGLSALFDSYEALYELQREYQGRATISTLFKNEDYLTGDGEAGFGCGAARNMVAVDTDGILYPCHRFVGYFKHGQRQQVGNVFDGFDTAAREFYIAANHLSTHVGCGSGLFDEELPPSQRDCKACSLSPVCNTNCMAVSEHMTGDPKRPSPINRVLAQIAAAAHLGQRTQLLDQGDDPLSRECALH